MGEKKSRTTLGAHVPEPGSTENTKTGGWRSERAIVDEAKCIGCGTCFRVCPENAISIIDKKSKINYDYCKGCGICAKECPVKAIHMEEEKK